MANALELARLEAALAAVGAELDYPPGSGLPEAVVQRLERGPARRPLFRMPVLRIPVVRPPAVLRPAWQPVVAAFVVALLFLSGLFAASPTVRQTVERWFGLQGVRIVETPPPSTLPPTRTVGEGLDLGLRSTLAAAQEHLGQRILVPAGLGPPDSVYVHDLTVGGVEVFLVYRERPGLPRTGTTGVGLLLSEFSGDIYRPGLQKFSFGATLRRITVDGARGFWIEGAHAVAYLDRDGNVIGDDLRLAGNVLLWERAGLTLRIESALGEREALALAGTIR
jgi:hypothetical protein